MGIPIVQTRIRDNGVPHYPWRVLFYFCRCEEVEEGNQQFRFRRTCHEGSRLLGALCALQNWRRVCAEKCGNETQTTAARLRFGFERSPKQSRTSDPSLPYYAAEHITMEFEGRVSMVKIQDKSDESRFRSCFST